ncbi:hypothetical protein D918_06522 [Trichuris suis]|nr:hypothetical protein D918_06522 [Trichuris suis]
MPFSASTVRPDRFAVLYEFHMEDRSDRKDFQDSRHRVKLYMLNEKRTWDDKGTGQVTCFFNEHVHAVILKVVNEEDDVLLASFVVIICNAAVSRGLMSLILGNTMLESQVQQDIIYQKQQGTLIVWTESENNDMALSFQDKQGCDEVWESICKVRL